MAAYSFSIGLCAATVMLSVHSGAVTQAADAFQESGGRVVMEVESVALAGSWTKETYTSGYTGTGFYEWKKGNTSTRTDAAGSGVLSYPVAISTTGRYRLQVRGQPAHRTEHNDVWIRVLGATKVEAMRSDGSDVRNLGANWTKSYNNSAGSWTWNTNTVDHDAHWFFVEAQAGTTITVELSGRSSQFKVDRIVLYTSAHTTAQATNPALPESPRGGGTPPPPPTNKAPSVNAGPNRNVTLPGSAALDGTVSDDGLPAGTLVTTWSKLSGPGTVTFASTVAVDTAATFSFAGTYVLRLSASDGSLNAHDDVTVTVNAATVPAPPSSAPAASDDGGDDSDCGLGFGAVACLLALTFALRGQGAGLSSRQP